MKRTDPQRKAIEVYCREVANALNEQGVDLKAVLEKKAIPVSCTQDNIKENIFKPILAAMFPPKTSTTELTTGEVTEVYEHMNRWTANEFGVSMEFPHDDP